VILTAGGLATGTASSAQPAVSGTPGYCPTAEGVTVVVDFQELGGGIVVRCAAGPVVPGYSGLDALQDAGFAPEGVRQYGLAFICRIAGKPAADQALPIKGDPSYHESCNQTPPPSAFWSYWYAPNGGDWTYSQVPAINRDAIRGGFEGWSFSLNHDPGDAPQPGVAPTRPPQTPPTTPPTTPPATTPPSRPPTHPPTHPTVTPPTAHPQPTHPVTPPTSHPMVPSSGSGGSTPGLTSGTSAQPPTATLTTRAGSASAAGMSSTSTSSGPSATPAVSNPVEVGHNAAGERVSGALPAAASPGGASAGTTLLGVGLVALLLAGGGVAAWRRRASRE
jgi:hypothetical protein